MRKYKRVALGFTPNEILAGADAPITTIGACKNTSKRLRRGAKIVLKCSNFNVTLGNGLCITCWDDEVDRRANSVEHRLLGGGNAGFKDLPD
jgi:hypothetical protein